MHFEPFASRQRTIQQRLRFECSCARCKHGSATDKGLARLVALHQKLNSSSSSSSVSTDSLHAHARVNAAAAAGVLRDDARSLVRSYRSEGLQVFLHQAYGSAALALKAAGMNADAAVFARKAVYRAALNGIREGADVQLWTELASDWQDVEV
jgi:hypothetical protein